MKPRLLVTCHDAGGAEVVSSWLKRHEKEWEIALLLDGPAVEIFRRKIDRFIWTRNPTFVAIEDMDLVLCGSSGEASLERNAVSRALAVGVRCAVYLDHWKNYAPRFDVLPDEVWVTDEHAEVLALKELPGANVIVKGNPYLEDIADEVKRISWNTPHDGLPPARPERILYIEEPGHEAEPDWNDFFIRNAEIHIRPHPSRFVAADTLAESVAWADTVIGWDSMALVAALYAGRRVISLLPASEGSLPFPEIERPFNS